MAVGFPVKADYATGDVLTAAQMNDLSGTLNTVPSSYGVAAGKNAIINGGMNIWQRGTSFTFSNSNGYTADRWFASTAGTGRTVSRQTGTEGLQYALRLQRDTGNTSTNSLAIGTSMEIAQAIPLQGKTITISFYAKAGANYSGASSQIGVQFSTGTSSTEANRMLAAYASGDATPLNTTATLTTSWQRFSYNVTLGASVTQFFLYLQANASGTAGANDFVDITGAQIEVGSVATSFSRAGGTIQGELAACQRYYQRFGGQSAYQTLGTAYNVSVTTGKALVTLPVQMRIIPTALDFNALMIQDSNDAICAINTLTLADAGTQVVRVIYLGTLTDNLPASLITNNSTAAYIGFSAEL